MNRQHKSFPHPGEFQYFVMNLDDEMNVNSTNTRASHMHIGSSRSSSAGWFQRAVDEAVDEDFLADESCAPQKQISHRSSRVCNMKLGREFQTEVSNHRN